MYKGGYFFITDQHFTRLASGEFETTILVRAKQYEEVREEIEIAEKEKLISKITSVCNV